MINNPVSTLAVCLMIGFCIYLYSSLVKAGKDETKRRKEESIKTSKPKKQNKDPNELSEWQKMMQKEKEMDKFLEDLFNKPLSDNEFPGGKNNGKTKKLFPDFILNISKAETKLLLMEFHSKFLKLPPKERTKISAMKICQALYKKAMRSKATSSKWEQLRNSIKKKYLKF